MPAELTSFAYIVLMLLGFGLIIAIHELGHFLAARWAGVRVHAFAVGFGPALVSFRKGMGVRMGSTEPAYNELLERERTGRQDQADTSQISPTEYRLNWVPLGGYVRMLGQEDGNPNAVSSDPDSFTRKPVWKRMIIVSAGVAMNMVLAAALFILVFLVGLREVAPIIGAVAPGSPAERAGLLPGDVVLRINNHDAQTFNDLSLASAFAATGSPITLRIDRPGEGEMTIDVVPELQSNVAGMGLDMKTIGVFAPSSTTLFRATRQAPADVLERQFAQAGLPGVKPGMSLTAIEGQAIEPVRLAGDQSVSVLTPMERAARESGGEAFAASFTSAAGETITIPVLPTPEHLVGLSTLSGEAFPFRHVLGLCPPMRITRTQPRAEGQGLRPGDVFARVGDLAWPTIPAAIDEIRAHAGGDLDLVLLRTGALVPVTVRVSPENGGTIGFNFEAALDLPIVAAIPELAEENTSPFAARDIIPAIPPGATLIAVDGRPVSSLNDARVAIQESTIAAQASGTPAEVELTFDASPVGSSGEPTEATSTLALSADAITELHTLGWGLGPIAEQFTAAEFLLKASGPTNALVMGVQQTHRMMMRAYLTIKRIIQGSVSPRLINGPVGITYFGSKYAEKGFTYYLFFLALISVNLAVVNFLPFPIIDGGLFLMLVYEGIAKRPVPIVVQNAATLVGLACIALAFVYVTINDLRLIFF